MNQTSIWKIEHGQPRRRITFDEAVAFAKVFDLELEDLLRSPAEVVGEEAFSALDRVGDLVRESGELVMEAHAAWQQWDAAIESEEVRHAIATALGGRHKLSEWLQVVEDSANIASVAWHDLWRRSVEARRELASLPEQGES